MAQPPPLTPEQRAAALEKAAHMRRARAQVKADLKSGSLKLSAALAQAKDNDVVGKLKVKALLTSLPGIGVAKADAIMKEIGISATRRVAGLGVVQREKLVELFG
ncbi:MAG: integration host factor, actinobacterial type [Actinomycetaceae bacterium]|nr:integration host factor, actinobacterial type [Actinomycetaceae bacterium]MDY5855077.1 integration host factor, actinobacterial type [Arcanobacterium sp.]